MLKSLIMKNFLFIFLLQLSGLTFCYAQVRLDSGLVAYYPFSGDANDASGNGNNAVFNTATLTTDKSGNPNKAYLFNGSSSYIQIPNSQSLNPGSKFPYVLILKSTVFTKAHAMVTT